MDGWLILLCWRRTRRSCLCVWRGGTVGFGAPVAIGIVGGQWQLGGSLCGLVRRPVAQPREGGRRQEFECLWKRSLGGGPVVGEEVSVLGSLASK